MQSRQFGAAYLGDPHPGPRDPDIDKGLNLEAITPELPGRRIADWLYWRQVQHREQVGPESVVSIAQVGVVSPEEQIDQAIQPRVSYPPEPGDVMAAASRVETRALGELGPGGQCRYETPGSREDRPSRPHPA